MFVCTHQKSCGLNSDWRFVVYLYLTQAGDFRFHKEVLQLPETGLQCVETCYNPSGYIPHLSVQRIRSFKDE